MSYMIEKPRYEHDCSSCYFLGQYEEYDLYYCDQTFLNFPTVIARFGDDGPDYTSGLALATQPPLSEAKRRAIQMGLLKQDTEVAKFDLVIEDISRQFNNDTCRCLEPVVVLPDPNSNDKTSYCERCGLTVEMPR